MKRRILALLFIVILLLNAMRSNTAYAATVKTYKLTIGIGNVATQEAQYVYPDKVNENAVYSYKSSDRSIVKVNKKSGKVKGIMKGTATISVTRKLNGKSKVVSKWKVKVVDTASKASKQDGLIYGKNHEVELEVSKLLTNMNANASYKIRSSNSSVVKVSGKAKKSNDYTVTLNTKKTGSSILTISQVTKKGTTQIGKVIVSVKDVEISSDNSYLLTVSDEATSMKFNYTDGNKYYRVRSLDSTILNVLGEVDDEGRVKVKALKTGMVTLYFYEGSMVIAKKTVVIEEKEDTVYAYLPDRISIT